jgi:hypothetical protein
MDHGLAGAGIPGLDRGSNVGAHLAELLSSHRFYFGNGCRQVLILDDIAKRPRSPI